MNFKSYEDLTTCIVKNIHRIPRDIDIVVGVPRSGTMVGNIIALYLNLPFTDLYSFMDRRELHTGSTRKCRNWIKQVSEARHVLVVDDSVSSGKAMKEAKAQLASLGIDCKFTFLAVYGLRASMSMADIILEYCEQPRMFEWNFMHHWALEYCCMDIDGVICEDPTRKENDDGVNYAKFLKTARPKFLPTQKVGTLVSCRLEKYRQQTEEWLKEHDVTYDRLILMDNISAKERALSVNHGAYKASIYMQSKSMLFFESDYDQALEICRISKKPVFCVERRVLINNDNVAQRISVRSRELSVTIKRGLKKLFKKIDYTK